MKPKTRPFSLMFPACLLALAGCAQPLPNMSFVSADKSRWVDIEQVAPRAEKDELLPTIRLRLRERWHTGSLVLAEGLETLCGTNVAWQEDGSLLVRLPADRVEFLKIREGEGWSGIPLHVAAHEDQVKLSRESPDGALRLVVIETCETESWNLYLRRAGEPNFNAAMQAGWDDPDLVGGFEANQRPLSLGWTGPREAEIQVPGKRYGVTVRDRVGEVRVHWRFLPKASPPEAPFETLSPIKH
jgi:hypothetical protein